VAAFKGQCNLLRGGPAASGLGDAAEAGPGRYRPISVYRLGEMPIQSCGHSVSALRGKAGARLNAHTELRSKRQRSAREAIYRNRPIARPQKPSARVVVTLNPKP